MRCKLVRGCRRTATARLAYDVWSAPGASTTKRVKVPACPTHQEEAARWPRPPKVLSIEETDR